MKYQVTYQHQFDAAHRLKDYDGPCGNVHGHRYVVEVTVSGPLNGQGMVIDFNELKSIVGGYIDANWDHALILSIGDPDRYKLPDWKRVSYLPQATAECMAAHLFQVVKKRLSQHQAKVDSAHQVKVESVKVWETPGCYVEVTDE